MGRLEKIKGVHTLIDVWDDLPGYDLLIAGTGTEMENLRRQAGGNPGIKFLGHVNQRDLGNHYVHALATLVPSLTYETFGFIVIESFARKTPVIVHDLGPLPELVRESNGGLTYRDRESLIRSLKSIAAQPRQRQDPRRSAQGVSCDPRPCRDRRHSPFAISAAGIGWDGDGAVVPAATFLNQSGLYSCLNSDASY